MARTAAAPQEYTRVENMHNALARYDRLATEALEAGYMDWHIKYGRMYHRAAEAILAATGVDPRPQE